jgi:hypothetical protein
MYLEMRLIETMDWRTLMNVSGSALRANRISVKTLSCRKGDERSEDRSLHKNSYGSEGRGGCKRLAEDDCIMPEGSYSDKDRRELPGRIEKRLKVR